LSGAGYCRITIHLWRGRRDGSCGRAGDRPKKRDQGLSCGQYLLLAALNRAVAPTSKLQFADWYRRTALTRLLPADPAWLSSQNFWNHMDRVTTDHIAAFEQQMSRRARRHLCARTI
jgi:hypothetical protein